MSQAFAKLLTVSALLCAQTAFAGTYVEELHSVSSGGQTQSVTVKTWVEGDMVRTDDPRTGQVLLINTRKNTIMGVDKAAKEWWRMKEEDLKMFGQATLMAYGIKMDQSGKLIVPENIFEKTGNRKKIGEWDAYEVRINADPKSAQGFKSTLWFANVKGFDPSIQRNRMKMFMGDGAQADAFMKQWDQLEGVPVLTEMQLNYQGQTVNMVQELKKVAPQKLAADQLAVPKGFKQGKDPITKMKEMMQQQGKGMPGITPPAQPSDNAPPPLQ